MELTIRELAYQKWEQAGRPGGDGVQFWLEAEQELQQKVESRHRIAAKTSGTAPPKKKNSRK